MVRDGGGDGRGSEGDVQGKQAELGLWRVERLVCDGYSLPVASCAVDMVIGDRKWKDSV